MLKIYKMLPPIFSLKTCVRNNTLCIWSDFKWQIIQSEDFLSRFFIMGIFLAEHYKIQLPGFKKRGSTLYFVVFAQTVQENRLHPSLWFSGTSAGYLLSCHLTEVFDEPSNSGGGWSDSDTRGRGVDRPEGVGDLLLIMLMIWVDFC